MIGCAARRSLSLAVRSFANNVREFEYDRVELNEFQRGLLCVGSAAMSLLDPTRHDMIASFGETSGEAALKYMKERMSETEEGASVLAEKPRINSATIDLERLKTMPEGTLGRTYSDFLISNDVTPDTRLHVRFVEDAELAYVMQRYRETHDLVHAALQMKTNMLGEVTIKWIEAIQNRLPMCIGAAIFGACRLKTKNRTQYLDSYLPWAVKTAHKANFLQGVYYEKRWDQPLEEFHREMNITPFSLETNKS